RRRPVLRRSLETDGRFDDECPAPGNASRDSGRDPRAEALLRTGACWGAQSPGPTNQAGGPPNRRGPAHPVDRVTVAIGLGSNLGFREGHLEFAIARLNELLSNLRTSTPIETLPVGVTDHQPKFLNAAAVGKTE